MKARYKGNKKKEITVGGETVAFPTGEWIVLPTIAFLNRLKSFPDSFDIVYDYDVRPFLKFGNFIRFGRRTIRCSHKPTIRALDAMPLVVRQAEVVEKQTVIYRIYGYSENYLQGFTGLNSQVCVLCKRHKGGIGDIIMTIPAMEAISLKYSNYVIDFACPKEYMPLLENTPFIRNVLNVDNIDETRYDIVYDMTRKCIQYEGRTQPNVDLNRTEIFANVVDGLLDKLPRTRLFLSPGEIEVGLCIDFEKTVEIQALVWQKQSLNDRLVIGVCVDSSARVRSYYYAEELINQISTKYPDAVILFFQKESKYIINQPNVYNIVDFSLREIMILISRCDFFFGPDTGLTHIAAALRVKTLWCFSHIDGTIRTKGYDTSEIVQDTPPSCPILRPCWYLFPCDTGRALREHLDGTHCQVSLTPAMVMQRMGSILSSPCVSIIVLCHNRFDLTKDCIQRLLRIKKYNDELILVDNGSTDETQAYFSKLNVNGFRYFRKESNTGCVAGRNFALRQARGIFVWMLDNDQFISDQSLQKIMETNGDLVGVEGWFIKEDGLATQYAKCGMLNYVGAGGMFARRTIIEAVGYFDENYNPAWFEDPDICFKAAVLNYTIGLCENANIMHYPHSTNHAQLTFDSAVVWDKNRKYFVEKWKDMRIGKPLVSIVILTHNDSDTTIRCLNSIYRNTNIKHFDVIVVDNGSIAEEKQKLVKFTRPNLKCIFNDDNLMVAAGRNVGASQAIGEFILFLDNDMLVPENWLDKMIDSVDQHKCVATAPSVVDVRNGQEIVRFVATVVRDGHICELYNEVITPCDFLPGGALFVNRKLFEKYPFDEKFVFGVEDYDWCMRVRGDGYNLINTPGVVFTHAKPSKIRTITPYDNAERERKGSSYIEDSIRLFLYRWRNKLPNQWKESGWLTWAVGRHQKEVMGVSDLFNLIGQEVAKLYPDELQNERN